MRHHCVISWEVQRGHGQPGCTQPPSSPPLWNVLAPPLKCPACREIPPGQPVRGLGPAGGRGRETLWEPASEGGGASGYFVISLECVA